MYHIFPVAPLTLIFTFKVTRNDLLNWQNWSVPPSFICEQREGPVLTQEKEAMQRAPAKEGSGTVHQEKRCGDWSKTYKCTSMEDYLRSLPVQRLLTSTGLPGSNYMSHQFLKQLDPTNATSCIVWHWADICLNACLGHPFSVISPYTRPELFQGLTMSKHLWTTFKLPFKWHGGLISGSLVLLIYYNWPVIFPCAEIICMLVVSWALAAVFVVCSIRNFPDRKTFLLLSFIRTGSLRSRLSQIIKPVGSN